jgi:hypothetical protein
LHRPGGVGKLARRCEAWLPGRRPTFRPVTGANAATALGCAAAGLRAGPVSSNAK